DHRDLHPFPTRRSSDLLRILNTVGKIRTSEVNRIYRQEVQAYRVAIEDLARGAVKSGFNKLNNAGFIKEIDPTNPHEELVEDYRSEEHTSELQSRENLV